MINYEKPPYPFEEFDKEFQLYLGSIKNINTYIWCTPDTPKEWMEKWGFKKGANWL